MSGIFGCWNATGAAAEPHPDLLAGLGSPRFTRLVNPHFGAMARSLFGGTTSIGRDSAEVLSHSTDGATCVFDGRLDNRDELLRTLDGDPLVRPDCPDVQLVVAAYSQIR